MSNKTPNFKCEHYEHCLANPENAESCKDNANKGEKSGNELEDAKNVIAGLCSAFIINKQEK